MSQDPRRLVLCAEDDPDDRLLIAEAHEESRLPHTLEFVEDGQVLLDRVRGRGRHCHNCSGPRPDLILLDLNMPRLSGEEALRELKLDPELRSIPVVVLTTSTAAEDVLRCYNLGANSFVSKPASFEGLAELLRSLSGYWFETVRCPGPAREDVHA